MSSVRGWRRYEQRPPWVLKVESTNLCNANCTFCAYQYDERPKAFMPTALYQSAVGQFAAMGGRSLSYVPIVGEPLLDKTFLEKVAFAKAQGMTEVFTYTNAILLDRIGIDALLGSGIDRIVISTTPFDEPMYRRIYRSQSYRRMLRNVEALLTRNNQLGRPVEVHISMRSDVDERTALTFPDYVTHIKPHVRESSEIGVALHYDSWGGLIKQADLSGMMRLLEPPLDKSLPCAQTFTLTVLADGRIRACGCRFNNDAADDPLIIGDLGHDTLVDVWQGEGLRRLRRRFTNGDLPSLCRKCSTYEPMVGW